jgi:3-oxo-5-alpha-steroid 4-dehydrogenase 1
LSEPVLFRWLLSAWFLVAAIIFIVLLWLPAPYGRHARLGWGPTVSARTGWLAMEAPASLLFLFWFLIGSNEVTAASMAFLIMWQSHYVHRAFVYPFSLASGRQMPVTIAAMGILFNSVNAYLNGRYLFTFSPGYDSAWLGDPRFVAGLVVFAAGYVINRYADRTLRNARLASGLQYCRIDDGIFRYVCCPNYLGEILIWSGWALATWSLAGLSFAAWTAANLVPRARSHARWCREYFEDFPSERKALVPGLW